MLVRRYAEEVLIAAISQVVEADEKDISISIGTVFILNAVALFIFPPIGHYFE